MPAFVAPCSVDSARNAWHDAMAVLFPVECAGCSAPDRALCKDCRALLVAACGGPFHQQMLSDATPVLSAVRYEGHVRRMILGFKEQGRTDVVRPLAAPLRAAIEEAVVGVVSRADCRIAVCAVPPSRTSLRRRGYRPVELLARAAGFRLTSALTSVAPQDPAMAREQKSLGVAERSENRRGAFSVGASVRGRRFVVVDDVVTSGATLDEAVRTLRSAGADVVSAVTLAFTPRRAASNSVFSAITRDIHRDGGYGG